MVRILDRESVQDLLENRRAQVMEVLPRQEYEWAHLPGAGHLPPERLDESAQGLDPARPVVVYGQNERSDQSRQAAIRLEKLASARAADIRPARRTCPPPGPRTGGPPGRGARGPPAARAA